MPRPPIDPSQAPARPRDHSWSTRLAWTVLVGGAALVVARLCCATVVRVHGDGMAPTLVDGDHVLLVRGTWSIDRGDVIVYRAQAPLPAGDQPVPARERDMPRTRNRDGREFPDARRPPDRSLRNTAVVDPEEFGRELEDNWRDIQARAEGALAGPSYRVGRVLAAPGDPIRIDRDEGGFVVRIAGQTIDHKPGGELRVRLREAGTHEPVARRVAWESSGERRYAVLERPGGSLPGGELVPIGTEVEAPGYLVLADNRDDGACCDSRAVGFVPESAVRGEVVIRLAGDPSALPDLDPAARGFQWKP